MGLISFTNISDGTGIDGNDVNNPLNTIYNEFNGNIDANNLKDNAVTTAKITNASVTPSKINLSPTSSTVLTDESTTSTSYTDLATVHSITATIGANGLCLVLFSVGMYNVAAIKQASIAVSGASTVAASDDWSVRNDASTFSGDQFGTKLFTGLTPGSNTFTMKFKTASGTARFYKRTITVVPL